MGMVIELQSLGTVLKAAQNFPMVVIMYTTAVRSLVPVNRVPGVAPRGPPPATGRAGIRIRRLDRSEFFLRGHAGRRS